MESDRLIGIVQPVDPEEVPITPDGRIKNLNDEQLVLYSTGCVGQISHCQESPDGRYFISLVGVCRFRLGDEIDTTRGYRRFNAKWNDFENDAEKPTVPIDRERFLPAMRRYFEANQIKVDWSAVNEAEDEGLVSALAMSVPLRQPRNRRFWRRAISNNGARFFRPSPKWRRMGTMVHRNACNRFAQANMGAESHGQG